jgi:hypothetical protein
MTTSLHIDANGNAVQSVQLTGTPTKITIGSGSASTALPSVGADIARIVRVASNASCYIAFGTSGISASTSDTLFPAGVEILTVPPSATHIACIQDGAVTGTFQITAVI